MKMQKSKQAPCQLKGCIPFYKMFVIRIGAILEAFKKIVL